MIFPSPLRGSGQNFGRSSAQKLSNCGFSLTSEMKI